MIHMQAGLRIIYIFLSFILLLSVVLLIIQYLFPLFLACIFVFLLLPIIRFFHYHLHIPYLLSCILAITLAIIGSLSFISILGLEIVQGIFYLAQWMPTHFQFLYKEISHYFQQFIQPIIDNINVYLQKLSPEQHTLIEEPLEEISKSVRDQVAYLLEELLYWLGNTLASIPSSFTILIISLLCTLFICKDWDKLSFFITSKIPDSFLHLSKRIYYQIKEKIMKYMLAQLQLIIITFGIILIVLFILQIEHAFTIALLIAIVDLIPILGTGLIFLPWVLFLFITKDFTLAIILLSLYFFIILLRQILEPKLISNAIGIHPVFSILAIYLGFQLFNFKGIWLGPCILFVTKACVDAKIFHLLLHYIKYNTFNDDIS